MPSCTSTKDGKPNRTIHHHTFSICRPPQSLQACYHASPAARCTQAKSHYRNFIPLPFHAKSVTFGISPCQVNSLAITYCSKFPPFVASFSSSSTPSSPSTHHHTSSIHLTNPLHSPLFLPQPEANQTPVKEDAAS